MLDAHIHVCFSGEFESFESSRLSPGLRRDRSSSRRSPSPLKFESFRSPSPQPAGVNRQTASVSSCPEMVGHTVREKRKTCKHLLPDILNPTCWWCFNYIEIKLRFKHRKKTLFFSFQGGKDTKKSSTKGKKLML